MDRVEQFDFAEVADTVAALSTRAQTTLLYRIIGRLGPGVCRTVLGYCYKRLDQINSTPAVSEEQEAVKFNQW